VHIFVDLLPPDVDQLIMIYAFMNGGMVVSIHVREMQFDSVCALHVCKDTTSHTLQRQAGKRGQETRRIPPPSLIRDHQIVYYLSAFSECAHTLAHTSTLLLCWLCARAHTHTIDVQQKPCVCSIVCTCIMMLTHLVILAGYEKNTPFPTYTNLALFCFEQEFLQIV
jgi:hypothetical protein